MFWIFTAYNTHRHTHMHACTCAWIHIHTHTHTESYVRAMGLKKRENQFCPQASVRKRNCTVMKDWAEDDFSIVWPCCIFFLCVLFFFSSCNGMFMSMGMTQALFHTGGCINLKALYLICIFHCVCVSVLVCVCVCVCVCELYANYCKPTFQISHIAHLHCIQINIFFSHTFCPHCLTQLGIKWINTHQILLQPKREGKHNKTTQAWQTSLTSLTHVVILIMETQTTSSPRW